MEELIQNYQQYKSEIDLLTKKMEKVKQKIRGKLNELPSKEYQNKNVRVFLKSMNRTTISKKDVPNDIWEKFSVMTPYETLYIKNKK